MLLSHLGRHSWRGCIVTPAKGIVINWGLLLRLLRLLLSLLLRMLLHGSLVLLHNGLSFLWFYRCCWRRRCDCSPPGR